MLGINKTQYKLYADFKRSILDATQKELDDKGDFTFTYKEIKYIRRVGAILFQISMKDTVDVELGPAPTSTPLPSPSDNTHEVDQLLLLIPEQHRNKTTIRTALASFLPKHGVDYVRRNILYSNEKAAKSYAGYLNKALKEDWGHDWEIDQQEGLSSEKKVLEIWEKEGFESERAYTTQKFKEQMASYGRHIN
jgi:hypothetical protein